MIIAAPTDKRLSKFEKILKKTKCILSTYNETLSGTSFEPNWVKFMPFIQKAIEKNLCRAREREGSSQVGSLLPLPNNELRASDVINDYIQL